MAKNAANQRFDYALLLQVISKRVPEAVEVLALCPITEAQLITNPSEPLGWSRSVTMCLVQGQLREKTLMASLPLRLDELKEPERFQLRVDRHEPFRSDGFQLLIGPCGSNMNAVNAVDANHVIQIELT